MSTSLEPSSSVRTSTDAQWDEIAPLFAVKATGRPPSTDRREIVNAILYMLRTGCQWRYLPGDFPPYSTAHSCHPRWRLDGTLDRLHDFLRQEVRQTAGRANVWVARSQSSSLERRRGHPRVKPRRDPLGNDASHDQTMTPTSSNTRSSTFAFKPMSLFVAWRTSAILEGISYLLLLFIAMPLKYIYDMPFAVRIAGSAHGLLFVVFMVLLAIVYLRDTMTFKQCVMGFVASLVPFGAFVFDHYIKQRVVA
mgnify:FL=1